MANIRKIFTPSKGTRYQVQIRKAGTKSLTKTFSTLKDARVWSQSIESEIERGIFLDTTHSERTTVSEALDRYVSEVLPSKKSIKQVVSASGILKKFLGDYSLSRLNHSVLSEYKFARLKSVSGSTVRKELSLLSRVLNTAIKDWNIPLPHGNPVSSIRMPRNNPNRTRRLQAKELEIILSAINNLEIRIFIELLVETAMRRGELASLEWEDVDLEQSIATIRDTKTGYDREIPLSNRAKELFKERNQAKSDSSSVFNIKPGSVTQAFNRACKKLGIVDLRLHDLRRECTSRLFEKGLTPAEVQTITGHRTLTMLSVYTKLKAKDLVGKVT